MNQEVIEETQRSQPMAVMSIDEAIAQVTTLRPVIAQLYPQDKLAEISNIALGKVVFDKSDMPSMIPISARLAASAVAALTSLYTVTNGPGAGQRKFPLLQPKEMVDNSIATRVNHPKLKDKSAYDLTWMEEHSCIIMDTGLVVFRTVQPVMFKSGVKVVVLVAHLNDFTKLLASSKYPIGVSGAMGGGVVLTNLLTHEVNLRHIKSFAANNTMSKPDPRLLTVLQIIGAGNEALRWSKL